MIDPQLLKHSRDKEQFRIGKVESIREEISEGTYETPDKLDVAADRLLEDIAMSDINQTCIES